ncbi:MAG: hypothetical protein KAV87_63000 [Desulfobacteraceae bacterium]|nr:hypothetical protein [Desulfobacteraceae bacterium]
MNAPRTIKLLVWLALSLSLMSVTSRVAQAAPVTPDTLATSCQELIAIYDKKGDQRFIAGMSTSVAEAMRAGICRGMIEEHANHNRCYKKWYDMASLIAEMDSFSNVEDMLDYACDN